LVRIAVGLVLVLAATLLRQVLEPSVGGQLPFITYFPPILLASVSMGWETGLGVMLLSGMAANLMFSHPRFHISAHGRDVTAYTAFLVSGGSIVLVAGALLAALGRLEQASRLERTLNVELQHRVKNTLAVVQALASQTLRTAPADPSAFYKAFEGRLHALAAGHELLSSGNWEACRLPELPIEALRPFKGGSDERISIDGPSGATPARSCVPLILALHELGTNAVKYGALSDAAGRVAVSWSFDPASEGGRLRLRWQETGGPSVTPPQERGLGSRLLTAQPGLQKVDLRFEPEGVICDIEIEGAVPDPVS
jgi:two-component sensor histidine kinase